MWIDMEWVSVGLAVLLTGIDLRDKFVALGQWPVSRDVL
jgi:hypothetical protein